MKPLVPLAARNANSLSPSWLNTNLQRMHADLDDAQAQRWCRSDFVLDFSGLANTDTSSAFTVTIRAPFAYEIERIDLVVFEDAGNTVTITHDATADTKTLSVDGAGATTRAVGSLTSPGIVASATSVHWTLSCSAGSFTLERCYVVVSIRADRWQAGTTLVPYSPSFFAAGDAVAAADVTAQLTAVAAANTANTAADKQLRIEVYQRRGLTTVTTPLQFWPIPSQECRIASWTIGLVAANTETLGVALIDDGGTTVKTQNVDGAGATSLTTATTITGFPQSQVLDAPTTPADDWKLQLSHVAGSGTFVHAFVVLYFT